MKRHFSNVWNWRTSDSERPTKTPKTISTSTDPEASQQAEPSIERAFIGLVNTSNGEAVPRRTRSPITRTRTSHDDRRLHPKVQAAVEQAREEKVDVNVEDLVAQGLLPDLRWQFDGERDSNYTPGPAMMVSATEGIKPSAAILLNARLSEALRTAVFAARDTERAEVRAMRRRNIAAAYVNKIDDDIEATNCRYEALMDIKPEEETKRDRAARRGLERRDRTLRQWREVAKGFFTELREGMYQRYEWTVDRQRTANMMLDQVLTEANLIDLGDVVDETESEVQFAERFVYPPTGGAEALMSENASQARSASTEYSVIDRNPEPAMPGTQEFIRQDYNAKQKALQIARDNFKGREVQRDGSLRVRRLFERKGRQLSETRTECDVRHLRNYKRLTGELVQAQAAMDDARHAAREHYEFIPARSESSYLGSERVERRLTEDVDMYDHFMDVRICAWRDNTFPGLAPGNLSEEAENSSVNDWTTRSVDFGESTSVIADGWEAKKLWQWQDTLARMREAEAERTSTPPPDVSPPSSLPDYEDEPQELQPELNHYDLRYGYLTAQLRMRRALDRFDWTHSRRADGCGLHEGGDNVSHADRRYDDSHRQATRDLIEAEEAFEAAKWAAFDAGFDIQDDDRASGFLDDPEEQRLGEAEHAVLSASARAKIMRWIGLVPEN